MRTKILTMIGLASLAACEVAVPTSDSAPDASARSVAPEAPEVEALPTSNPFEAFLYPSLNMTSTIASHHRDTVDSLDDFDMFILGIPTDISNSGIEAYRYPVFIESEVGVEYQYVRHNVTLGQLKLCSNMALNTCYADIRNVRWISQTVAAMDVCYFYNSIDWNICTTKYSNE